MSGQTDIGIMGHLGLQGQQTTTTLEKLCYKAFKFKTDVLSVLHKKMMS